MIATGATMGTTYTIKAAALPSNVDPTLLHREIEAVLESVDRRMSTYDPESELSRFNRSTDTGWFPVSSDTARVIDEALRIGQLTGGAFDVTVGPLVDLWHFGPGRKEAGEAPSPEKVAAARERVGFERLEVRLAPPAVRKSRGDVRVDLSGIAKGFAVDRVAALLERRGVENYMVEIGGETRTRGRNSRGTPWQIAIEAPSETTRTVQEVVRPGAQAMATSGDYRNYFISGGRRYCHILDPRTGRPVVHRLVSATVLDASCATADALATALMVLGPEKGYELASQRGMPALLLIATESGLEERMTPEFAALLGPVQNDDSSSAMPLFVATFVVMGLAFLAMALGAIAGRRRSSCACKAAENLMARTTRRPREPGGVAVCDASGEPLLEILPQNGSRCQCGQVASPRCDCD